MVKVEFHNQELTTVEDHLHCHLGKTSLSRNVFPQINRLTGHVFCLPCADMVQVSPRVAPSDPAVRAEHLFVVDNNHPQFHLR
ncbi:MAG: hypothetical protein P8075_16745 [Deltaproteobacteria bacterium]